MNLACFGSRRLGTGASANLPACKVCSAHVDWLWLPKWFGRSDFSRLLTSWGLLQWLPAAYATFGSFGWDSAETPFA